MQPSAPALACCAAPCEAVAEALSTTERIFRDIEERGRQSGQSGGAGGSTTYKALQGADAAWARMRNMPEGAAAGPAPTFVRELNSPLGVAPEWDVLVCGGTLGVFLACSLQVRIGTGWGVGQGVERRAVAAAGRAE